MVKMSTRNALRRATAAAPWTTATPRSWKPVELCRTVWSSGSPVRGFAPVTPNASPWKGGRSFAAAAECTSSIVPTPTLHARTLRATRWHRVSRVSSLWSTTTARDTGRDHRRYFWKSIPDASLCKNVWAKFSSIRARLYKVGLSDENLVADLSFPIASNVNPDTNTVAHKTLKNRPPDTNRPSAPDDHDAGVVADDDAGRHRGVEGCTWRAGQSRGRHR